MKILLIAGGWSTEREVSLSGARIIHKALESLGHVVTFLDLADGFDVLAHAVPENDFAYIALHGSPGEDGLVQAFLDQLGCPYQGSGPAASFLALNKAASKAVFDARGIRSPEWQLCPRTTGPISLRLPYPVFVKPNMGGSSVGMSRVPNEVELSPALDKVFAMGEDALVEKAIPGVEVTCAILDQTPLPLILIKPKPGAIFFDYANKYDADGAEEICPAPVSDALREEVQRMTLDAHRALGCEGYSRADFIVDGDTPYLLEVNTLPGMTATSLLPRSAKVVGMDFENLVAELIRLGMERGRP
ncbi:MAG: D-alanine--D-alanine ligase [Desulfovibrionaceae bacterium]